MESPDVVDLLGQLLELPLSILQLALEPIAVGGQSLPFRDQLGLGLSPLPIDRVLELLTNPRRRFSSRLFRLDPEAHRFGNHPALVVGPGR